jgi:hypothetical protein
MELSVKQEGLVAQIVALLPEASPLRDKTPAVRADMTDWVTSAKLEAAPFRGQWAQMYRMDADYEVGKLNTAKDEETSRVFRAQMTMRKAELFIEYFEVKPATEAMLTRLAEIEDRAWDKVGSLDGIRAVDCYKREYLAAQRLEAREVEEMLGLGIDPGADAKNHATEGQADEVEPISEGSSVNRRKR